MQYLEREELSKISARRLPIESGDGRTLDTAYILWGINQFEAPAIERIIIDLTLKASSYLFWYLHKQIFTIENDREIDIIQVQAHKKGSAKKFTFYFDLTELE